MRIAHAVASLEKLSTGVTPTAHLVDLLDCLDRDWRRSVGAPDQQVRLTQPVFDATREAIVELLHLRQQETR